MPEYHQVETVQGYDQDQILLIALGTFKRLGWDMVLADENRVAAMAPGKGSGRGQLVDVETAPSTIITKSQMVHNETFDLFGKNRKNIAQYLEAFHNTLQEANETSMAEWESSLRELQQRTIIQRSEAEKEAGEIDAVMNLSNGSQAVTYSIIGLNVIIYLLMVISGVHFFEPTVDDLARWGGNYKPMTTGGEWWRAFTAMFIHVGILHLLLNMYALLMVGRYLEPMLGIARFLSAYIASGLIASLASMWWNQDEIISAGASGAIFGMYGVFLALLLTNVIPASVRKPLLTSIGVFIFYNLVYGAGSKGIDNAAHIGGLVSGFAIGMMYLPTVTSPGKTKSIIASALALVISIAILSAYIINTGDDSYMYEKAVAGIVKLDEEALAAIQTGTDAEVIQKVNSVSKPKWQKAKETVESTMEMKVNKKLQRHRDLLLQYFGLRLKQADMFNKLMANEAGADREMADINDRLNMLLSQMGSITD